MPALLGEITARHDQARIEAAQAQQAIETVTGMNAIRAVSRLRFGPGRTCEPVARIIEAATTRAELAGIQPATLIIAGGLATPAEDIVRVRRKFHGKADWIASPTADIEIELRPAGLHATQPGRGWATEAAPGHPSVPAPADSPALASADPSGLASCGPSVPAPADSSDLASCDPSDRALADRSDPAPSAPAPAAPPTGSRDDPRVAGPLDDPRVAGIRERLFDVIDPDLGVNIVDLGFVRDVALDETGQAIITMTLTSAACPVTGVMEDQIRTGLLGADPPLAGSLRIEWQWTPSWQPCDITPDGREQLRAIGFTV